MRYIEQLVVRVKLRLTMAPLYLVLSLPFLFYNLSEGYSGGDWHEIAKPRNLWL